MHVLARPLPLPQAVRQVIEYLAAEMKKKDIDIDIRDQYDCTPLHMAAMRGNEAVTLALLQLGADVEVKDYLMARPLHEAVTYDHCNVVKLLLDHQADVSSTAIRVHVVIVSPLPVCCLSC